MSNIEKLKRINKNIVHEDVTIDPETEKLENLISQTFLLNKMFYKNKKTEQYMRSIGSQFPQDVIYALSNS